MIHMKYRLHSSTGNTIGIDDYLGYSELDEDGYWSRYLQINADGTAYRYSRSHEADEFGVLPEGQWDESEASELKYGTIAEITSLLFEAVWARTRCDNDSAAGSNRHE
jgi:hypothetical protein